MALSIHRPVSWSIRRRARTQPARGPLKVAMFPPSSPRDAADLAGRFVFNTVEHLRDRHVEVEVVSPGSYRDFGLTGTRSGGVVAALKRRPWLALLLLVSMIAACRAAARRADLVHANWLPGAARGPLHRPPLLPPRPREVARGRGARPLQRPPLRRQPPRLWHRRPLLRSVARAARAAARPPAA